MITWNGWFWCGEKRLFILATHHQCKEMHISTKLCFSASGSAGTSSIASTIEKLCWLKKCKHWLLKLKCERVKTRGSNSQVHWHDPGRCDPPELQSWILSLCYKCNWKTSSPKRWLPLLAAHFSNAPLLRFLLKEETLSSPKQQSHLFHPIPFEMRLYFSTVFQVNLIGG